MPDEHPWDEIERDYLAGKYKDLRDIAAKTGISYQYVQKKSSKLKWKTKKNALKKRVQDRVVKEIENEFVSEARKDRKQLRRIANLMINQGYQRFVDPETGLVMPRAIANMQTAISAMSGGAKILMRLSGIGSGEGDGETNVVNFVHNQDFRGIPDGELEQVHRQLTRRLGIGETGRNKRGAEDKAKRKK